jgi:hypothetical protein
LGARELACVNGNTIPNSSENRNVIDLAIRQSNSEDVYKAPMLYVAQMAHWNIPKTIIPNQSHRLVEWETMGQGMEL